MEYEVGTVLEGKVTSITKFGAFVALEGGKSGLVHISEIANSYVNDVHDFLQEGQDVKVKLLAIKDGKLDLSIKKVLPAPERPAQNTRHPHGQASIRAEAENDTQTAQGAQKAQQYLPMAACHADFADVHGRAAAACRAADAGHGAGWAADTGVRQRQHHPV